LISLRRPQGELSQELTSSRPDVRYLLPISVSRLLQAHLRYALGHPLAYFGTLLYLLTRPHPTMRAAGMTLMHFGEGVCAADMLRDRGVSHLHAHFMDRASTVALVASRLLGIRYSLTAHAADIYVHPVLAREKIHHAALVVTCTDYNRSYLAQLAHDAEAKIKCIYHGLELSEYTPVKRSARRTPVLLCVGQLQEKKGIAYLLQACRLLLEEEYQFGCVIVGEGPLRAELEEQIRRLRLGSVVALCGALPHQDVIRLYGQASVFVLPAVISADGDRDGIPNVILEAMAMKLPVISTRHSGIPEVVEHGVNGLLVRPSDAEALKQAIGCLLDDPTLARQLGECGRQTVAAKFDLETNVSWLLRELEALAPQQASNG
jgi:glycosyltransferase involved in cell wall biosynthesis